MGELMRRKDWAETPLGSPAGWSDSLRTAVSICLQSRFPILIWWGPEMVMIYNDAYRPMLGDKHPQSMGQRGRECWSEIWHIIGPMLEGVRERGEATWSEDQMLPLARYGFAEECYFTFSYSPIHDETGAVGGVFCAVTETTRRVLGERRLATLRELGAATKQETAEAACRAAASIVANNPADLPFALVYLTDGTVLRLAGSAGLEPGSVFAPVTAPTAMTDPWPVAEALRAGTAMAASNLASPGTGAALVVSLAIPGHPDSAGLLIAGISPRLALDEDYRGFLKLVAGQIATAVSEARAFEAEKRRAEALAEIDRAKTAFFNNISHEFRTPLTLMIGPLEDAIAGWEELSPVNRDRLLLAQRNAARLLKLVNTLLEFSRIEAGRIEASYELTDLAMFTAELASVFRSAIERAALTLKVDCQPLPGPAFVDREMWEKIVLNLLSNAFKFTFTGAIEVALRGDQDSAVLTVSDTGIGIPAEELPRLFDRFHRVKGARGRSYEGSGIGLALVQELARLHGGTVRVESEVDRGSKFIVTIPLGAAHLPENRIGAPRALASTASRAGTYVEEVLRWLPENTDGGKPRKDPASPRSGGSRTPFGAPRSGPVPRVILADDNADMRGYLARLLAEHYEVEAVADGVAALQAARRQAPDLILSDVMMPHLDGFGLIQELRADANLKALPVILLSARAGEEARVDGLEYGADDYLIKPFSARDLLARVNAQLNLAQLRRDATGTLQQSHRDLRLRAEELRAFNEMAVGRELRMIELKREFNQLCAELGRPPRFPLEPEEPARG